MKEIKETEKKIRQIKSKRETVKRKKKKKKTKKDDRKDGFLAGPKIERPTLLAIIFGAYRDSR